LRQAARCILTALGAGVLLAAVVGEPRAVQGHRDPHPLPPDTMVVPMREPGVYGGRFVIGATGGPKTFNGITANETSSTDVTNRLYCSLVDFDNLRQQIVPQLAKSWSASADGLTWTFHLRRGAAFSDGHLITSDDVRFCFDVAYDESLHPAATDLLKVEGRRFEVSAPDSYTVVIRLESPYALFLPALSALRILPRHRLEASWKAGHFESAYGVGTPPESLVTSGPWRLKQFVSDERVVLAPNPFWFGVDARGRRLPYLDELVYLIVPDQNTVALKFRAGELDALDNTKPEDYQAQKLREKRGGYTVYEVGPSLVTNFMWFNLNLRKDGRTPCVEPWKYELFRQADFRRAVSQAIDRDAMIRGPLHSRAYKNWATTTRGNRVWHDPDIVHWDYAPAEARRRLAGLGLADRNGDGWLEDAAGHTVSFTLLTNADNTMRVALANMAADDLKKVGLRLVLVPIEFNTLITRIREDFNYEACLLGTAGGVPPDPGMSQNVYRSSGKQHYWHIEQSSPATPEEARIDALTDQLMASNELALRKRLFLAIKNLWNDQCWFVWMPSLLHYNLVSSRFGNVQPTIIPHRILWNIDRVYRRPRG
jgi:peptide/nickel transport system substrate-binding protein